MTFFDFVVGVTVRTLLASLIIGSKYTEADVSITLITLTILVVATGFITLKSPKLRRIIEAVPVALVKNGKIVQENLKQSRITLSHLKCCCGRKTPSTSTQ